MEGVGGRIVSQGENAAGCCCMEEDFLSEFGG